jgi:hypothetical protein
LPQLFANIRQHLVSGGLFVASVATFPDQDAASGAVWHVTVRQKDWWESKLSEWGLELAPSLFEPADFPRGPGGGAGGCPTSADAGLGFHLVARLKTR